MENYLLYTIIRGDTLVALAVKYGIDWKEIATANDLDYPFIVEDKSSYLGKNVKTTGETLLVPSNSPAAEVFTTEEDYFGSDIKLSGDTELDAYGVRYFDTSGQITGVNGDIECVSGLENLMQSIVHKLMTSKGEIPLHPEIGCDLRKLVGKSMTFREISKAKLEVEKTIKSDSRVKEIRNLYVNAYDRQVVISCEVFSIFGSKGLELKIPA